MAPHTDYTMQGMEPWPSCRPGQALYQLSHIPSHEVWFLLCHGEVISSFDLKSVVSEFLCLTAHRLPILRDYGQDMKKKKVYHLTTTFKDTP